MNFIQSLPISKKAKAALIFLEINCPSDFNKFTKYDLLMEPGIGIKSFKEIEKYLKNHNIEIRCSSEYWGGNLMMEFPNGKIFIWPARISKVLKYLDVKNMFDLLQISEKRLLDEPNCGQTMVDEIKQILNLVDRKLME